jgi:hypothetical protein
MRIRPRTLSGRRGRRRPIRHYDRWHQVIIFLDAKHTNITNSRCEPWEIPCHFRNRNHTGHSIDVGGSKINAALLIRKTFRQKEFFNLSVGVVAWIAISYLQSFLIEVESKSRTYPVCNSEAG